MFGTILKGRIADAQKSRGKNDSEAKQNWRAEDVLRRTLGLPRKFAAPTPTSRQGA